MRGLALSIAAAALLSWDAVPGAAGYEVRKGPAHPEPEPKPKARPPRPAPDVLAPIRPPGGRVYRGGSVPGGARRAIEREMRAQEECPICEGCGWEMQPLTSFPGHSFRECEACGNPKKYESP